MAKPSTRNVTLSLPADLLVEVKVLAAQRGTSMSKLMTAALASIVASDDAHRAATDRLLDRLAHPYDLGTQGRPTARRHDLHER